MTVIEMAARAPGDPIRRQRFDGNASYSSATPERSTPQER